jgi:hypothetical protein
MQSRDEIAKPATVHIEAQAEKRTARRVMCLAPVRVHDVASVRLRFGERDSPIAAIGGAAAHHRGMNWAL